jgi:hypothetical protein
MCLGTRKQTEPILTNGIGEYYTWNTNIFDTDLCSVAEVQESQQNSLTITTQ